MQIFSTHPLNLVNFREMAFKYINLGGLGTPLNMQNIYDQNNDLDSGLHALYDFWYIDTP